MINFKRFFLPHYGFHRGVFSQRRTHESIQNRNISDVIHEVSIAQSSIGTVVKEPYESSIKLKHIKIKPDLLQFPYRILLNE